MCTKKYPLMRHITTGDLRDLVAHLGRPRHVVLPFRFDGDWPTREVTAQQQVVFVAFAQHVSDLLLNELVAALFQEFDETTPQTWRTASRPFR